MQVLVILLVVGLVDLVLLLFVRQLRRERFDVINKGTNQAPGVTLAKALGRTGWRIFRTVLPFYLVLAFYFYLLVRRDCRREPVTRAAYEARTGVEHVWDALTWPRYSAEEPACER